MSETNFEVRPEQYLAGPAAGSAHEASHNLLAASGAYDQCKASTSQKITTIGDEMLVHGALDAYIGAQVGGKVFGPTGAVIGAIGGLGVGLASGYERGSQALIGAEQECRAKNGG